VLFDGAAGGVPHSCGFCKSGVVDFASRRDFVFQHSTSPQTAPHRIERQHNILKSSSPHSTGTPTDQRPDGRAVHELSRCFRSVRTPSMQFESASFECNACKIPVSSRLSVTNALLKSLSIWTVNAKAPGLPAAPGNRRSARQRSRHPCEQISLSILAVGLPTPTRTP
jgi:hypothetical protein